MAAVNSAADVVQAGGVTGTSWYDLYGTAIETKTSSGTPYVSPTTTVMFNLERGKVVSSGMVVVSTVTSTFLGRE